MKISTRLAAVVGVVLAVVACTGPTAPEGAPEPASGELQFVGDTGYVSINAPEDWEDITDVIRDEFRIPGATFELSLQIDGTLFVDASSINIVSYELGPQDPSSIIDQSFTTILSLYGVSESSARRDSVTTSTGFTFDRQRFTISDGGFSGTVITYLGELNGTLWEITASLFNEGQQQEQAAIDAVDSITLAG